SRRGPPHRSKSSAKSACRPPMSAPSTARSSPQAPSRSARPLAACASSSPAAERRKPTSSNSTPKLRSACYRSPERRSRALTCRKASSRFSKVRANKPRITNPRPPLALIESEAGRATAPVTANVVRGLAKNLRLFGWVEFWLQAVFAVFTALLLEFATSGRAFSPGASGFGDAIYWAADGFLLLLAAVFLAFYYTRAARKIASKPDSYLSKRGLTAFWFLLAGLIISLLGILVSFVGVALSISLLIAKTVSQPPGIAITDPSKIIRALDVFILLVNCNLLMAHFIGAGVALWLGLNISSARLKYATIARRLD